MLLFWQFLEESLRCISADWSKNCPQNIHWIVATLPDNKHTWELYNFYIVTVTELYVLLTDSIWIVIKMSSICSQKWLPKLWAVICISYNKNSGKNGLLLIYFKWMSFTPMVWWAILLFGTEYVPKTDIGPYLLTQWQRVVMYCPWFNFVPLFQTFFRFY